MSSYSLGDVEVLAFVMIPLALVALLAWGTAVAWRRSGARPQATRRAVLTVLACAALWMSGTWTLANRGVFLDWESTPPPFALLVLAIVVIAAVMAFGPLGRRLASQLPLWTLVAVQAFRWPLEMAMHRLYERGIMPVQMSYSGRSWDVVTGMTAVVVALLVWSGRGEKRLVTIWNIVGLGLLINIVVIAIASTPRFQAFGPERVNVFVMYPPFVWLPAVMVLAALSGHLVIFRAMARET